MRKLEILSRYLPYGLRVKDWIDEFYTLDLELLSGKYNDCHLDDLAPILFSFEDLTKEVELHGERFIPYKKLAIELFEDAYTGADYTAMQRGISIPIGEGSVCLCLGPKFSIYYTQLNPKGETETMMTPVNQYKFYEWFIKHHFAVGLEEDEYIKK